MARDSKGGSSGNEDIFAIPGEEDRAPYLCFTRPARLNRSMHVLEGIVRGVAMDGAVVDREVTMMKHWLIENQEFLKFHPFNEVTDRLGEILADGIVDEEERADILWLCEKFTTSNDYYHDRTADMQRLHGILGGIASDGIVSLEELRNLENWIDTNQHLKIVVAV